MNQINLQATSGRSGLREGLRRQLDIPECVFVLVNSRQRMFSFTRTSQGVKSDSAQCEVSRWLDPDESALVCFLTEADAKTFCKHSWSPIRVSLEQVRSAAIERGDRGLLLVFRNEGRVGMFMQYVR